MLAEVRVDANIIRRDVVVDEGIDNFVGDDDLEDSFINDDDNE